jgi:plasmid stabilization system protein ParE
MYRLVFREGAKTDIEIISVYTKKQWGESLEQKLRGYIRATAELLALFPHTGLRSNQPGIFVKAVPHVPFVVVYELKENTVIITQILHTKRSP